MPQINSVILLKISITLKGLSKLVNIKEELYNIIHTTALIADGPFYCVENLHFQDDHIKHNESVIGMILRKLLELNDLIFIL